MMLALQGISTIAWMLKRYKVHKVIRVIVLIGACLLGALMAWIGIFDVVFNIRLYSANKEAIRRTIAIMKKKNEISKNKTDQTEKNNEDNNGTNHDDERKD